jgi:tripartite-type tricarboxylate transporter receptor subunit TctC
LPDVPTFREQGVALGEESTWFGIFVPKGTPAPIIAKLNSDVEQVLAQPAMQARAVQLGLRLIGGSPARLAAWSQNDIAKWAAVAIRARLAGASTELCPQHGSRAPLRAMP